MLGPKTWITLAAFKRAYPLEKPLKIKYAKSKDSWAWHVETDTYHYITFNINIPRSMEIEVLIHEYAHALDGTPCRVDHRNSWGIWYARLYRIWEKITYGKKTNEGR
jgi:hypothetical protein